MKTPSEFQLDQMVHAYDATYAREYYLRTRKLKGRKPKAQETNDRFRTPINAPAKPARSLVKGQNNFARARQKKALQSQIHDLESKLVKLEKLIRQKTHEEASDDRKSKAKKERAAKDADKPKTAAEKAEAARENKKYRDKNQQQIKSDAKKESSTSGGGSSSSTSKESSPKASASDLKTLATKVRGQIAVAKQKLAAL